LSQKRPLQNMHAEAGASLHRKTHTVARRCSATKKHCHSESGCKPGEEPASCRQLSRPALQKIPNVEIIWKFCGKRRLTGFSPHCMVVKFRGQSETLSSVFAWTEFAPPRRTAIRSLTTRLNVPVVRNRFGHKSERSHKLDHHGLQAFLDFDSRG